MEQEDIEIRDELLKRIKETTKLSFSRSGGPGGQNVNKRDTKVTAKLSLDLFCREDRELFTRISKKLSGRINSFNEVVIQSSEARTQAVNTENAYKRLEILISEAMKPDPKPRRLKKPGRKYQEKRLTAKKRRGAVKKLRQGDFD